MNAADILFDRANISDVLYRYAKAIDTKDWDLFATCFTEDVEVDFSSAGWSKIIHGRDPWTQLLSSAIDGLDATQHLTGNHVHEIRGDEATLTAYVQAVHQYNNPHGDPEYTIGGYYDCELLRTPDGWRIRKYRVTVTWRRGNSELLRLAKKK